MIYVVFSLKCFQLSILFLQVSDVYTTAQSYVFIQQDGERSIIMASGATSIMNKKAVEEFFGKFSLYIHLDRLENMYRSMLLGLLDHLL